MLCLLQLGKEISVRYDYQKVFILHVDSTNILGTFSNVSFIKCVQFKTVML